MLNWTSKKNDEFIQKGWIRDPKKVKKVVDQITYDREVKLRCGCIVRWDGICKHNHASPMIEWGLQ